MYYHNKYWDDMIPARVALHFENSECTRPFRPPVPSLPSDFYGQRRAREGKQATWPMPMDVIKIHGLGLMSRDMRHIYQMVI